MKYIRIFFIAITVVWTLGAVVALMDSRVGSVNAKLVVLVTATACVGVVASWPERRKHDR
jgi:hypothetical protein